ncbi:hypothetical protein [Allokutzneria albata]|uniref:Uncharacterized protein n=1 Tax=Allokutzneria albata TaxID=211114 RepID=A0A1H0A882_ALLAB|nr:hypothetical protein [Allokutzneria albata]SDN29424.1 hypothetical protein SAMN04489726_5919 [Allokutzneria albata]
MIAFRALFLLLRGRKDVPEGGVAVPYSGESTTVLVALLVASLVEIVAVEFLVPWATVRWSLLLLSVYGVVWILGHLASLITRPHVIGPANLVLRNGSCTEHAFPLTAVRSARAERKGNHEGSMSIDDETLNIPAGDTTTVFVAFDPPQEFDGRTITGVRFHADDPKAALRLLARTTAPAPARHRPPSSAP